MLSVIAQSGEPAKRPSFRAAIETRILEEMLGAPAAGEVVTYAALSAASGVDVQGAGRSALASARRMAERDYRAVFATVRNVGLRRLSDPETVASSVVIFTKIRRDSRRVRQRLGTVEYAALSDDDKIEHNTHLSLAGATELFSTPKAHRRIAQTRTAGELPIGETLKLFSSTIGVAKVVP